MTNIEHFICDQWDFNKDSDYPYWWERTSNMLHGAHLLSIWVAPEHEELLESASQQADARMRFVMREME